MTKMKSKKMSKSTFAVIIMAIAMVAMLAFGGTYAYFTASVSTDLKQTVNLGRIALDGSSTATKITAEVTANVLPTEDIFGEDGATLTIKDDSNRASYIFIEISAMVYKAVSKSGETITYATSGTEVELTGVTLNETSTDSGVYYILTTEGTGGTVGTAIDVAGLNAEIPAGWDNTYQQAKVEVTFTIYSIQAAGFDSAATALEAYVADNGTNPIA